MMCGCLLKKNEKPYEVLRQAIDAPEQDGWIYDNPITWCNGTNRTSCNGPSMVCDVFVMSVYKSAGVFGNLTGTVSPVEFVPRDAYQVGLFNTSWVKPTECQDNYEGYCQVLGGLTLPLVGFNSVPLHSFMDNHCGALPPSYARTPKTC